LSTPKIGRAFEKAANVLAYESRKLREKAHEDVLNRLHEIGKEEAYAERSRKQATAEEQIASIQPLIRRGRELLADTEAARTEAIAFVRRFDTIQWNDLLRRYPADHGTVPGSSHSTRTRIAHLHKLVNELSTLLAVSNANELTVTLRRAEELSETASDAARYVVNDLIRTTRGSAGESLREKVRGIKKRLLDLGDDILAPEAK
jgi:hypothetical protein